MGRGAEGKGADGESVEEAVQALFLKFKRTTAGDLGGECGVTEADVRGVLSAHGAEGVMACVDDEGCNLLHHATTFFGAGNDAIAAMLLQTVRHALRNPPPP